MQRLLRSRRYYLLRESFTLGRVTGSHHVFVREDVTFIIPKHGKSVKTVFVKRVVEILEEETK